MLVPGPPAWARRQAKLLRVFAPRSADAALSSQYARSKEIKSGSMSIYWNISGDSIALALEASATGQASKPLTPFTIIPQPTIISPP